MLDPWFRGTCDHDTLARFSVAVSDPHPDVRPDLVYVRAGHPPDGEHWDVVKLAGFAKAHRDPSNGGRLFGFTAAHYIEIDEDQLEMPGLTTWCGFGYPTCLTFGFKWYERIGFNRNNWPVVYAFPDGQGGWSLFACGDTRFRTLLEEAGVRFDPDPNADTAFPEMA